MNKANCFNSHFFCLAFVFAAAFILRSPSFFVPYYNIDEITNSLFVHFLMDGMELKDFSGHYYWAIFGVYELILKIFGAHNLRAVHFFHAIWVGCTAITLYFSAFTFTASKKAGLIAGLFYAVFSITFLSKDFHAANAESFSLLPASLAGLLFFRALQREKIHYLFWTGVLIGFASAFKTPAGILIVPVLFSLLLSKLKKRYWMCLWSLIGLGSLLLFPFLFTENILLSLKGALANLTVTKDMYINAYESLSFTYWFTKYCIRTILVMGSASMLWFFAFSGIRKGFLDRDKSDEKSFLAIFFLFLWLVCAWLVVSMGKRVFFHYFVFLFPPLCLLASWYFHASNIKPGDFFKFGLKERQYGFLTILSLASVIAFTSDGFLRWSLKQKNMTASIAAIRSLTAPTDRIYIWGLLPQLYFYSERKPASTMIWADSLAGFSPGTAAMEYMRATGKTLTIPQAILYDLRTSENIYEKKPPDLVSKKSVHELAERELLSFNEILELIQSPLWHDFFRDILKNPPVLFLDTSPTGIRGFSNFQLNKYELLNKFIVDNYEYIMTVDGIVFYRLKNER